MKIKSYNPLLRLFNVSQFQPRFVHDAESGADSRVETRIRQGAAALNHPSFDPFFAERVMNRIQAETANAQDLFFDMLKSQFRPLALATAAIMMILASYNVIVEKEFSLENLMPGTEITYEDAMNPSLAYFGD